MKTQTLSQTIRARYPLIWLATFEEQRALQELEAFCEERNKDLLLWSCVGGIKAIRGHFAQDEMTENPDAAIERFMESPNGGILVMADLHGWLDQNPPLVRLLRETAQALRLSYKTIVLMSPCISVPEDLEKDVTIIEYPLPGMEEMLELVNISVAKTGETAETYSRTLELTATPEDLARALLGLTLEEARSALALAAVKAQGEDIPLTDVLEAKKAIVKRSGALEYLEPPETDYFRGYELLRSYLDKLSRAFEPAAREFGVEYPKGVLLVSPPGCGKSLITKLVAKLWGMPAIRLDLGAVFGKYVGQSEENIRRAIQLAEAVSPAVLQIDEIEKGFAGTGSSGGGEGHEVTARVFGAFLTWMQEHTSPVVVLATANNISALPPELMRKGRFDELFMMDLPNTEERQHILDAHLALRGRWLREEKVGELAKASEGFSGAELEQAVKEALLDAYSEEVELTPAHVMSAIVTSKPLSQTMAEQINALRKWGQDRARPASKPKEPWSREAAGIEL